ncbi:MAG: hypothetical protein K5755_01980 [Clostridiales bacterium]|nr:hypothetical protein [Clostridiales bacterium]
MKKNSIRIIGALLSLVIILTAFSSCSNPFKPEKVIPNEVKLKTDLKDASFTFTYGELKKVIPLDKLAPLFENYEEKNPDTEITLSYNEIVTRFSPDVMKDDGKALEDIWSLASDEELNALKANKKEVVDYFNNLVNDLKTNKPAKTEYNEDFWTDDSTDSVTFTKDGKEIDKSTDEYKALRSAAVVYKKYVVDGAYGFLMGHIKDENGDTKNLAEGSDGLDDILYLWGEKDVSRLTYDDIESAISSVKKDIETVDEKDYVTGLTRTVVITLKPGEETVKKAFSMHDKKPVLDELKKSGNYFTVEDYDISFGECVITAVFDAVTDEITSLTYQKNMTVTTEITGVNDFASLGTVGLSFNCTDQMYYHFGWHTSEGE